MGAFSYLDNLDEAVEESYREVSQEQESVVASNETGNGFGDVYTPAESEAPSSYEPQKLNARHREMIRLHVLGYKGVQIANILGVTPQNVYDTLGTDLAKSFIQEIEEARNSSVQDVRERLQEFSPLAAETILDLMDSSSDTVKYKSAKTILEMTGQKPGESVNHNHIHLTKEDIEDIKKEHAGGPGVITEGSEKEFNETNRELPEAQVISVEESETSTNQAEHAKHIQRNSENDTGKE